MGGVKGIDYILAIDKQARQIKLAVRCQRSAGIRTASLVIAALMVALLVHASISVLLSGWFSPMLILIPTLILSLTILLIVGFYAHEEVVIPSHLHEQAVHLALIDGKVRQRKSDVVMGETEGTLLLEALEAQSRVHRAKQTAPAPLNLAPGTLASYRIQCERAYQRVQDEFEKRVERATMTASHAMARIEQHIKDHGDPGDEAHISWQNLWA